MNIKSVHLNTEQTEEEKENEKSGQTLRFLCPSIKKSVNNISSFSSVQFSSVAQSCLTLCDPMDHSTPGLPVHHQLLGFTQTHVHWVSDTIQSSHPLLLPSILPRVRVFSNESDLYIRWPKYWSFSFSISPSNEHSGLISFRIDWFDLAVQGTLKSLLQHHSSKASIRSLDLLDLYNWSIYNNQVTRVPEREQKKK